MKRNSPFSDATVKPGADAENAWNADIPAQLKMQVQETPAAISSEVILPSRQLKERVKPLFAFSPRTLPPERHASGSAGSRRSMRAVLS